MTHPILVAGGGIGGLATAAGLAQKGIASIVVEQAEALREIGAGIQIGPNAFHCFDALGVGEVMRREAVYIDALRLMDAKGGEEITRIPLGDEFRAFFRNPYAVIHRADLHKLLLDFCMHSPLVDIRTGHRVTGYDQDGDSATLRFRDHDPLTGRAVIAAEGLNSPIRNQMLGDGPPRISGHTTYRSVIPTELMPEDLRWNAATLWAGPKCHIVHYPLKGGKVYNLVVTYHRDLQEAISGRPVPREEVMMGFEHIHPRARQIIEHGTDWKLWVLCDREPVSNWVDGRVALLGDAAHPMLQYFAQGACMAMEDAVCLADSLDGAVEVEAGLQRYQSRRLVRTARVQMNSRLIGDYIYHPDDAKAAVRDHVMNGMSAQDWYRQLDWIYGSNGLEG
jgi:3-hydroxybenzoate 6-monooxygenase